MDAFKFALELRIDTPRRYYAEMKTGLAQRPCCWRKRLVGAWRIALVFGLLLLVARTQAGTHERVTVGAEPAWITRLDYDPDASSPNTDASELIVLYDKQVEAQKQQSFVHMVRRVLNGAGVQSGSHLQMAFDPAYASVQIHRLQIRRGGQVLNRLDPDKIQVLQRERELERYIYSGQLSVVVFLEDVRPGDDIEYAYTLTGSNPIFDGKCFDSVALQWPLAVHRFRFRLLWPEGRPLFVKTQGTEVQPVIRELRQVKEYVWELNGLPALLPEPQMPVWYDPYPHLQLSEFATWRETAQWAARLYQPATQLSPELERQIANWSSSSPDGAILAALQFVQDDRARSARLHPSARRKQNHPWPSRTTFVKENQFRPECAHRI
jgi:hypothetical protein